MILTTQNDFFNKIKDGAIKGWKTHKVLPSISLAQAALESAWGKSELATKGNNLFGIKGTYNGNSVTVKTSEFVNGAWIKVDAKFRKYPTWNESIEDHGTFFNSSEWRKKNYKDVIGETDYKKAANALQKAGYATDPTYSNKLIKLIEEYKLNQWDNLKEENIKMTTILMISGHGENKDKTFDPGAIGFITKGEHKYFEQDLFKAMKKFLPKTHNIVFFSEYNVYDYGNLVALANKYGSDTIVVEWHFDAGVAAASGGHVIVHKNYSPDNIDLKIRDVIKKHVGVRYTHKGQSGISGRTDLANVKRAASGNINYRLVEVGFGTSPKDSNVMLNKIDALAKDFILELVGSVSNTPVVETNKPVVTPKPVKPETKSVEQLAREVMQGMYGSGEDRKKALGSKYDAVQKRVNELASGEKPVPASKSIDVLVKETLAGVHGNGDARKRSLGSNYEAVMNKINGKVATPPKPAAKSIDTLVAETLAGKHGNGDARKKSLGSNYNAVMNKINGGAKPAGKSIDTLVKETLAGKHGNGEARKKSLGSNYDAVMRVINKK